ncbi:MAG: response regulator [Chloroflexi bacterium]|nr:response regulator [Chloroflexota bacterium]MCI0576077.1 response regulator [Chloroflexota bacterium]MCI0647865.1 response regulator [Chloroflexota bacterium]MCI0727116.1 response regulator [Chloroflexota bacterium]
MSQQQATILVVDDHEDNRNILFHYLALEGYAAATAENGRHALELLADRSFDLILLDIMMPRMNGYEVLERLKADPVLRHIPVIVISARDEMDSVVRCIELGAEDYLPKPFNMVLLRARIGASLEKKRLRDQEQKYLKQLEVEQARSERLLLNILPAAIAEQLKDNNQVVADLFSDVTVMFADIVNFTPLSTIISAPQLVATLNDIFSTFDNLAEQYGLEKIKTIGDEYMVVGGLPTPRPDHAEAVADMALAIQEIISSFRRDGDEPFQMRIGIATGPVIAGVIGVKKFAYDLWGDTVNTASRMETHGLPGTIQVPALTYERLQDRYLFQPRGPIEVKGKGSVATYLLLGKKDPHRD